MVVEMIGIAGAGMVVGLGELARRAVLGRRLEHELAEARSTPTWRPPWSEPQYETLVVTPPAPRGWRSSLATTFAHALSHARNDLRGE
jgi:hypothetical protein